MSTIQIIDNGQGILPDVIDKIFIPFFTTKERGKGTGRKLVEFWEKEMKYRGHELVITSTDANEDAQQFHRKMGYRDSGCILFPKELFPTSTMEILLLKVLT